MVEKKETPKVRYVHLKNLSDKKLFKYIKWWSDQTKLNVHTLSIEPAEIINNTIFAVFAFVKGQVVGAAGLMQFPDQMEIYFRGTQVLEFRANCVDENFERFGIGTALHEARIAYVDKHQYHAIMITKETKILRISKRFGWRHINRVGGSHTVLTKVRKCKCQPRPDKPFKGPRCETCPFFQKSIFFRLYQEVA